MLISFVSPVWTSLKQAYAQACRHHSTPRVRIFYFLVLISRVWPKFAYACACACACLFHKCEQGLRQQNISKIKAQVFSAYTLSQKLLNMSVGVENFPPWENEGFAPREEDHTPGLHDHELLSSLAKISDQKCRANF